MTDKLERLHRDFMELYGKGLVGINNHEIQITLPTFKEISAGQEIFNGRNSSYIELSCVVNRIKYVVLI